MSHNKVNPFCDLEAVPLCRGILETPVAQGWRPRTSIDCSYCTNFQDKTLTSFVQKNYTSRRRFLKDLSCFSTVTVHFLNKVRIQGWACISDLSLKSRYVHREIMIPRGV